MRQMKTKIKRYIQVYTGNGKGKTTAALGLAIRAAGYGLKTYMGQFMKGQHYGELTSLRDNPHITIEQYGDIKCIRREEVAQACKYGQTGTCPGYKRDALRPI